MMNRYAFFGAKNIGVTIIMPRASRSLLPDHEWHTLKSRKATPALYGFH